MKYLITIVALLMTFSSPFAAEKSAEERLKEIVDLQSETVALGKASETWAAYIAGDYEAALKEWRPLAEAGDTSAQVYLGIMHNQGHGVPQDDQEAVRWYKLAAEKGYSPAQWRLAVLYKTGTGIIQDYQEAVRLYKLVAEAGDAYAQNALGEMFRNGLGVSEDKVMAYVWFDISGSNGYELGKTYRDQMARKMTSQEITKAQTMVSKCIDSDYKSCEY